MVKVLPTVADCYTDAEAASFYERGVWREASLWDEVEQAVRERGDSVFFTDGAKELTYRQLRDQAASFATHLHAQGFRPGDRMLVQLPNWVEFPIVVMGAARAGLVTVPVMTIYRDNDLEYLLNHSGAKVAVTAGVFGGFDFLEMHQRLRDACPSVESIVTVRTDSEDPGCVALDDLVIGPAVSHEVEPLGADDPLLVIYTSGTTSRPKGCVHTWNTTQFTSRLAARAFRWTEDDVFFGPSPIGHGTGLQVSVFGPLVARASSHLMDVWTPNDALMRIERYRCSTTITATPFLQMLVDAYDPNTHDASTMRVWVAAGAPIPPRVIEEGRKVLEGCEILSLYGRSENYLTTLCEVGDPPERSTTSDGRAPVEIEVAIVDPDGAEVPRGESGDIAYRGPGHMLAYFRDPEETAALFTPDGFSRSGDLGYMDEDGYVRVTGRIKDIIIRGGLNISAREIEDQLLEHPTIKGAAVVAMPDDRLGERACAYLVVEPGHKLSFEQMIEFLRDERKVATQKLPERLEIVDELPMTSTGKIQKHHLREDIQRRIELEGAQG